VGEVAVQGNRFMKKKAVLSKAKVKKNDVIMRPHVSAPTWTASWSPASSKR